METRKEGPRKEADFEILTKNRDVVAQYNLSFPPEYQTIWYMMEDGGTGTLKIQG